MFHCASSGIAGGTEVLRISTLGARWYSVSWDLHGLNHLSAWNSTTCRTVRTETLISLGNVRECGVGTTFDHDDSKPEPQLSVAALIEQGFGVY